MNAAANFSTDGSADLTQSQTGITYIFTVPPESPLRNCSGTVVSLQYCYQARNGDRENNRTVFNFLSLTQNGMRFTVNRQISTRTIPSNTICTKPSGNIQQICCDNTSLSIYDRFQIPSSSGFAFGVGITNRNVRPLAFTTSQTEYQVEQYRTSLGTTNPFTLASNEQMNNSFLLFRFFLGMIFLKIFLLYYYHYYCCRHWASSDNHFLTIPMPVLFKPKWTGLHSQYPRLLLQ